MRNIYGVIEYIGTNYCGFQIQRNGVSIEEKLQNSIFEATGEMVRVIGSGRTDAGVHALGQVINFEMACSLPVDKMPIVFNRFLPSDIRFISCKEVSIDFNARKSAKRKTYLYRIDTSPIQSVYEIDRSMYVGRLLDIDSMRQAADSLVGEHDFKAFMASGSQVTSTIRTIYGIKVSQKKNIVEIEVTGNGFLYNMVRIIAGTFIDVGLHRKPVDIFSQMLTSGDRSLGGNTAKACGLYLKAVKYK